jgi:hypothetical protein
MLRNHSAFSANHRSFDKYRKIYEEWEEIDRLEEKAKTWMDEINLIYGKSIALNSRAGILALNYCEALEKAFPPRKTFILQLYYYRLKGIGYQIVQDYHESIAAWTELEEILKQNPVMEKRSRFAEAALQKMVNYLHLRDYVNGNICAETCNENFTPSSNNWFIFKEYHYLLAMQSGAYKVAGVILSEVIMNERLATMPLRSREKWKIFEAYFRFIALYRGLDSEKLNSDFKLGRFLNEVVMFSHDKKGFNIAVLIVQVLSLLHDKKMISLVEKIHALIVYRTRYLRKDINYRANIFITMLIEMDRQEYNYEQVSAHTKKLHKKLKSSAMVYKGNMEGLEVIPFEILWDIVLELLKRNEPTYMLPLKPYPKIPQKVGI